jgi:hypothetical protein
MAEPKKLPLKNLKAPMVVKKKNPDLNMERVELPDDLSEPSQSISDYGLIIYGETGIGKSSLCKYFGKPFYFRFEPSSKSLRLFQSKVITNWPLGIQYLRRLEEDKRDFTTVVVDTGGPAYARCLESICEKLGISHPGRVKDYGASWGDVNKEFQGFFTRISALNMGIIVIGHESTEEHETKSGEKYDKIVPHFSGSTMDFFKRWIDIIGYYFYVGTERWMLIRGTEHIMAKCNLEENFLTTSGKPVVCIPMGNSSLESYNNFINAFENKQVEDYSALIQKGGITGTKTVVLKKISDNPEPKKLLKKIVK